MEEVRAHATTQAEGRIRNYETAFRVKDGRWMEVSLSLLRDVHGAIIGTLAIYKDMTEHVWAEEALREGGRSIAPCSRSARTPSLLIHLRGKSLMLTRLSCTPLAMPGTRS